MTCLSDSRASARVGVDMWVGGRRFDANIELRVTDGRDHHTVTMMRHKLRVEALNH